MNNRGVITVKVLLLMMSIIMVFTLLLTSLQRGFKRNNDYRNKLIISQSILAGYDTYLYVNYGLYGFSDAQALGYIKHDMYPDESFDIRPSQPLSDVSVIENQILDYMSLRMPVNYMDQIVEKLELVKSSSATSDVLNHKKLVDTALSDLEHVYVRKDLLAIQVNALNRELIESVSKKEDLIELLHHFRSLHFDLIEEIEIISRETTDIGHLIDETIQMIQGHVSCIDMVKEQVIDHLKSDKAALYSFETSDSYSEDFLSFISTYECSSNWYPTLNVIYENLLLLDAVIEETSLSDEVNLQIDLSSYQYLAVIEKDTTSYKDYYKNELDKQDDRGEIQVSGSTCNHTVYESKSRASFWSVIHYAVQDRIDDLKVNEYIISTFTSFAESSHTDYNFFNKYERPHFFAHGEIEYILMGHDQESINIMQTYGVIFGVRTVMNGIHVYTDKEKLALSETIGLSLAGWTGFGAPLVSNIIRGAWASGESIHDMTSLLKGESMPFYKFNKEDWHYDLGLVYDKIDTPPYMKIMDLTYHDYLRFMLMTVDSQTKLKRIVNLIELDMNQHNKTLLERYTVITIGDLTKGYHE